MTASLALVRAVGKVEPDHIDAGADHLANHGLGVGGWSERGDNLGAALRRGFGQVQIGKGHGDGSGGSSMLAEKVFERVKEAKGRD